MDKFGHHIHKRLRLPDFIENFDKILMKTESGEFDLHNTRLTGITIPLKNSDAVNKEYVDRQNELYIKKEEIATIVNNLRTVLKEYVDNIIVDYCTKADLIRAKK